MEVNVNCVYEANMAMMQTKLFARTAPQGFSQMNLSRRTVKSVQLDVTQQQEPVMFSLMPVWLVMLGGIL
jgi:hypothetical protein